MTTNEEILREECDCWSICDTTLNIHTDKCMLRKLDKAKETERKEILKKLLMMEDVGFHKYVTKDGCLKQYRDKKGKISVAKIKKLLEEE